MIDPRRRRRRMPIFVILLLVAIVAGRRMRERQAAPESSSDDGDARRRGEIAGQLQGPAAAESRDGLAAIILFDVSGSMRDRVREDGGRGEPKIEIARRAALDLVRRFDQFAREHPDQPVKVGVYEFSSRTGEPSSRPVVPIGAPDVTAAEKAIDRMRADGGTPIGDAMIAATRELRGTGLTRRHVLVVTDGQNTDGFQPGDVAATLATLTGYDRPSLYFVAFDIGASRFDAVKQAGGLVLSAENAGELNQTLDYLLSDKILVEAPAKR
ncbi:MAG: VWA domain-containing protein [Acidobacteria bacterium]|nr:VWA domain-containing protein [Acidobacteriota bacterium]